MVKRTPTRTRSGERTEMFIKSERFLHRSLIASLVAAAATQVTFLNASAESPLSVLQNLPTLGNAPGNLVNNLSNSISPAGGPGSAASGSGVQSAISVPILQQSAGTSTLPALPALPVVNSLPAVLPSLPGTLSGLGTGTTNLLPQSLVPGALSGLTGATHTPQQRGKLVEGVLQPLHGVSNSLQQRGTVVPGNNPQAGRIQQYTNSPQNIRGSTEQAATLQHAAPQFWQAPLEKMPGVKIFAAPVSRPSSTNTLSSTNKLPVMVPFNVEQTRSRETSPGRFALDSGSALFIVSGGGGSLVTPLGEVNVQKSADVIVSVTDGVLRVQNLDAAHNGVRVQLNNRGDAIALAPGFELIASSNRLTRAAIAPADGILRRNPVLADEGNVAINELRLSSVIQNQLNQLDSAGPGVRRAVGRVLKTAAIMDLTRGAVGFVRREVLDQVLPGLPPIITPPDGKPPGQGPTPPVLTPEIGHPPPAGGTLAQAQDQEGTTVPGTTSTTPTQLATQIQGPAAYDTTRLMASNIRGSDQPLLPPESKPATQQKSQAGTPAAPMPAEPLTLQPRPGLTSNTGDNNKVSSDNAVRRTARTRQSPHAATEAAPDLRLDKDKKPDKPESEILQTVRETIRRFPELALAVVLVIAGLLVLSLVLARAAILRTREVEAMNKRLEGEVQERRAIEQTVRGLNTDLEKRVAELDELNKEVGAARDQAVQASLLKSQFVANISHEIRTPISAVIGLNQLLLETELQPEQEEYASLIQESAQSLLTVINDILDFSKIEAGMIDLSLAPFSIEGLLKEVSDVVSTMVRQKGLLFATAMDSALPATITGDKGRLRQVLVNLAGNAVKFTSAGEVVLQVSAVKNAPDQVRFSVQDSGIGIPEDAMSKLFQPFVQADGTTTRRFGGTGLGLSISKRLVELMGGNISVESEEGLGSRFWFDVPLSNVEEPLDTPASARSTDLPVTASNTTVLPQELQFIPSPGDAPAAPFMVSGTTSRAFAAPPVRETETHTPRLDPVVKPPDLTNPPPPQAAADASRYPYSGRRVIIVSNNKLSSKMLQDNLRKLGFKADCVNEQDSVATMKSALPKEYYEVAAVDSISCPAAADQIKSCEELKDTPVVGITNSTETSNQQYTAAVKVPFDVNEVTRWIISILKHEDFFAQGHAGHTVQVGTSSTASSLTPTSVLAAEDSPVLQQMLHLLFEKLGWHATIVSNGMEAVERAKSGNYSMIFMDWQMPGMDGLQATQAIRDWEATTGKHVPIVAMTANAMQGDRDTCLRAGMDDYISKPFSFEELKTITARWFPKTENEHV